jgi:hypothetical protein
MSQSAPMSDEDVAIAVATAVGAKRRIVDEVSYRASDHTLLVTCGQLTLAIDAESIPEIKSLPRDEFGKVELSASGASIIFEATDVYIESAALVIRELQRMLRVSKPGNLIIDFFTKRH